MRHRRIRRFRNRPNGRSHHQRPNGDQGKFAGLNFPNDRGRNNFRSSQSMEKLIDKYSKRKNKIDPRWEKLNELKNLR